MSLQKDGAMNGNVGNPYTTGYYVRQWILDKAKENGRIEFTAADIAAATGELHNRVSAMLCVLRHQGHISVIGKIKKRGANPHATNGGYKYLAEWKNVKDMSDLPLRQRAKPYTVERGHGAYKSRKYMTVPIIDESAKPPMEDIESTMVEMPPVTFIPFTTTGIVGESVKQPLNDKSLIEELLNIGIDLQERGENRDAGLRLLKLTERIFKSAK